MRKQRPWRGDKEERRLFLSGVAEEEVEILEREGAGEVFLAEDVVGEGAFFLLEEADFFLDRAFDDESLGEYGLFLTDAVRAVDRPGFDGGVQPRIEEHDIAGGSELEAGTLMRATFSSCRSTGAPHLVKSRFCQIWRF